MTKISKKRVLGLMGAIVLILMLAPAPAKATVADIIILLTTITNTLRDSVGQVLSTVQSVSATARDLEQQVAYPVTLINQTKSFVSQTKSRLTGLTHQIDAIRTSSATLTNPAQLESLLRAKQASGAGQISAIFTRLYGPVPGSADALTPERNLMDADDAAAMGAFKTATISDQKTDQMLALADGLEQQAASAAPGSAGLLTAQAQAANLQNQAMLQRMLAAQLRQEATELAHANALRKRSAEAAKGLNDKMQQIFTRP